jgi:hypothetical protein
VRVPTARKDGGEGEVLDNWRSNTGRAPLTNNGNDCGVSMNSDRGGGGSVAPAARGEEM